MHFLNRLKKRLVPLGDLTAWVLLILSLVPLWFIDQAALVTLLQWSAFGLPLTAMAIMISRMVFPQLDLSEWVQQARIGNPEAGRIIQSIVHFVALLIVAWVLWAK